MFLVGKVKNISLKWVSFLIDRTHQFCKNLMLQSKAKSAKCLPFECFPHIVCNIVLHMEGLSDSEDIDFMP